ncbi:MAG: tetratricopeptide repeat protein [Flavobacteriales bacterium]
MVSTAAFGQKKSKMSNEQQVAFTNTYINADKARLLGNPEEAYKLYQRCLELDPSADAVYYSLGKLQKDKNNLNGAKVQFEKALKLDPENKWYYQELAIVQADLQDFKSASKTYEKLLKKYPGNPEFILNYANFLLLAGDDKGAMKTYDEFEAIAGVDPEVSLRKYRYFASAGKYDLAAAELQKLIDAMPGDAQLYGYLADLYQAQGKTQKALEVYEQALGADPNNAYIQLSLAEYYERTGKNDTGFEYLQMAYANSGLDIDTKVGVLLRMHRQAERDPETRRRALILCNKLISAHPSEAKGFSIKGDFLFLDRQLDSARASYYQSIDRDPSKFAVWNQVMIIDSELEDPQAMLDDSKRALEMFPTQPGLYLFHGISNNQLEHYKEAAASLKTGLTFVVGNPLLSAQMLASLGDAYHELGHNKSSDSAYNASLSYDPESLYVLNNYSYFLSLRGEQLERAKEMSGKTIAKEPKSASYQDTYGWILFQLGQYEDAEKHLKTALENGGHRSGEVLEHYGDTLFKLGRVNEAVEHWVKAKALGDASEKIDSKISTQKLGE